MDTSYHTPVLRDAVVSLLVRRDDGTYVDCTLGGGGHAEAICERLSRRGRLIGIDRDPDATAAAAQRLSPFGRKAEIIRASFSEFPVLLGGRGIEAVDGILFDLGVSSHQLDDSNRGFSYRGSGPLDMRMDPSAELTAGVLLNERDAAEIADILFTFGEERYSRRIARRIVEARQRAPLETTADLSAAVERSVGKKFLRKSLSRVFQALRIAVNDELLELESALHSAVEMLRPAGRIVVISYHSLEDRIVKAVFKSESSSAGTRPRLMLITKRPLTPAEDEIHGNPRARSAKLRCAERVGEP